MVRRRQPPRAGALIEHKPLTILSQILMLQAAYYAAALVLIIFTTLVAGQPFSLDLVLSWRSLRGDNTVGWTLGLCWMLDSFIIVILLLLLVARSKLVPDFALTLHFIHFIVTSLYTRGIPTNILWWGLQVCSAAFMVFLGIWACQWRELRPMNFGGKAPETPAVPTENHGDPEDEESSVGYGRERGRGKGRDGAGAYEMVPMKDGAAEHV